jgi:hypothetical protein
MNNFKNFLKEDDFDTRMAAQKKRQEDERLLANKLTNHYTGLEDHHYVLHKFTSDSKDVNSYLWEKHKDKNLKDLKTEEKINNIDKTLNIHKTPEDMTVWSKSKHDPRELKNSEGIMHHPAYFSTSIKKSVAEQHFQSRNIVKRDGINHHHIFKINVSKGSKGVYIPDEHSVDFRAKEFLIPHGQKLKYHNTETQEDGNKHYHIHNLSLIK